jgi:hypothetical protein
MEHPLKGRGILTLQDSTRMKYVVFFFLCDDNTRIFLDMAMDKHRSGFVSAVNMAAALSVLAAISVNQ